MRIEFKKMWKSWAKNLETEFSQILWFPYAAAGCLAVLQEVEEVEVVMAHKWSFNGLVQTVLRCKMIVMPKICQNSSKTIKHLWRCWLVSEICVGNLGQPKNVSSWNISRGDFKRQFLTVSRARIFWLLFWRLLVTGAFAGKPCPIGNHMIMM